ncbi:MAG TPA: hypothetical protein VFG29_03840 [Syntrophales bacterium]|nr:hypothetical protein [Syntrophales bacterium]
MEKEEKQSSRSWDQEDELSHSEFGFVYEFFISEEKNGSIEKTTAKEQLREKRENELKVDDQSVAFFLPDFFTDET